MVVEDAVEPGAGGSLVLALPAANEGNVRNEIYINTSLLSFSLSQKKIGFRYAPTASKPHLKIYVSNLI